MSKLITYDFGPGVECFTAGRDSVLPYPVVQGHQIHDVTVARIDRPDITREQLEGYDAFVTDVPGIAVGVRSADCIPILLHDPVHHAVAAVHSGWRGTLLRVAKKAIVKMTVEYSTDPSDLKAVIGPGICMDCFQVGEEVAIAFRDAGFDIESIWDFRGPKNSGDISKGHHIDLRKACMMTLIECGVPRDNIRVSDLCTYERTDILYSARKEGNECGRNITAIKIL